jgi:WD40 repeat protein
VVYEGHWSRVTSIYTIPGKDILVTLSESNIKIWDLEYDECIKNMNEHSALIIYCAISKQNDQLIVTISQNLEYKEWNYITGVVVKAFQLNIKSSMFAEKVETQPDSEAEDSKLKTDSDASINLIACHISENQVAFLALESNHIVVHNLMLNQVFCVFKSYQSK